MRSHFYFNSYFSSFSCRSNSNFTYQSIPNLQLTSVQKVHNAESKLNGAVFWPTVYMELWEVKLLRCVLIYSLPPPSSSQIDAPDSHCALGWCKIIAAHLLGHNILPPSWDPVMSIKATCFYICICVSDHKAQRPSLQTQVVHMKSNKKINKNSQSQSYLIFEFFLLLMAILKIFLQWMFTETVVYRLMIST